MSRFQGRYPGGPRRPDEKDGPERGPAPDLAMAEEMELRTARLHRVRTRRRRRRRVVVGFLLAFVAAGGVGFWLGRRSHRTAAEIARQEEEPRRPEPDLTRERNAILQQLWLMEDLERARRP